MSTAVDGSTARLEGKMNGHHNGNGSISTNGIEGHNTSAVRIEDETWEKLFLPPALRITDDARAQKIERVLSGLLLCGGTLRRVAEVFEAEMEAGLHQLPSSLQMENTYVPELPNGTEEGVFLALDLGGTNFRILLIELKEGQLFRENVKHYHISDELRLGTGVDLFDFLADCVQHFLRSEGMEKQSLSLGFTFSFPMKHHSISSGELITWTKSFNCSGLEGVDVAALLQRSLDARGLDVCVRVLLNDTTGTLVAGAQADRRVEIAAIIGTGSNGSYMERASRVARWETAHDKVRDVCVDIEWGAFGDNGCIDFIKTDIDLEVDQNSLLVNSFTFEKYIGGKYMGSILSLSLATLARAGLFPAGPLHNALQTADMSLFEEENSKGETSRTVEVLRKVLPSATITTEDALIAQHVAQVISNRAAQLVSVCISTLLRRMDRKFVGVAVDGSVYKRHPRIAGLMKKYIALLAPHHPFVLLGAEDGSGKGSALTAAIAARIAARDAL